MSGVRLQALPTQGPCWYSDSWLAPRGGGRRHIGVDVFTRSGEYVYAVVDGTLTRRAWDQPWLRAGNAWWLTAADGTGTYYFYAHLFDFAPDLKVGSRVKAGQIIGWVGATGNAGAPHLHFEIHPFGGPAINPYPVIRAAGGCRTGTPYTQPSGWTPGPAPRR
jgi:peptidoglycan LD-endopeptidase LytH